MSFLLLPKFVFFGDAKVAERHDFIGSAIARTEALPLSLSLHLCIRFCILFSLVFSHYITSEAIFLEAIRIVWGQLRDKKKKQQLKGRQFDLNHRSREFWAKQFCCDDHDDEISLFTFGY